MIPNRLLAAVRSWGLRTLSRAPSWLNGSVDRVVDQVFLRANNVVGAWRYRARSAGTETLPDIPVPTGAARVLVAPANYAGQGNAWARAITSHVEEAGAVNLAIEIPGRLQFSSDYTVSESMNLYDRAWQSRELAHVVENFTHVLVEAETPIFGMKFGGSPSAEQRYFEEHGLSMAYICHGTDIRSPRRHIEATPFSPFFDEDVYFDRVQRRADRNFAVLEHAGVPVFVSTPDLIDDFPRGTWVPVVVDTAAWAAGADEDDAQRTDVPLVLHSPSRASVKGSQLIRAAVTTMADRGVLRYSELSGVPPMQVRRAVMEADIVLDQFRLGSYGVAACEAMAAGKVVLGHVTPRVREYVLEKTGLVLPIVEATPDTLEQVLTDILGDRSRMRDTGAAGQHFVREVHDGRWSASRLEEQWIRKDRSAL
ncbi:glycosyltransferase [Microbacterium sp. NPDC055988]|uniref:glycosyltransferase n=1 Tax=Microbacterium sp. NPDC055988 TaxID=3345671 RepID=UPI0035E1BE19